LICISKSPAVGGQTRKAVQEGGELKIKSNNQKQKDCKIKKKKSQHVKLHAALGDAIVRTETQLPGQRTTKTTTGEIAEGRKKKLQPPGPVPGGRGEFNLGRGGYVHRQPVFTTSKMGRGGTKGTCD